MWPCDPDETTYHKRLPEILQPLAPVGHRKKFLAWKTGGDQGRNQTPVKFHHPHKSYGQAQTTRCKQTQHKHQTKWQSQKRRRMKRENQGCCSPPQEQDDRKPAPNQKLTTPAPMPHWQHPPDQNPQGTFFPDWLFPSLTMYDEPYVPHVPVGLLHCCCITQPQGNKWDHTHTHTHTHTSANLEGSIEVIEIISILK